MAAAVASVACGRGQEPPAGFSLVDENRSAAARPSAADRPAALRFASPSLPGQESAGGERREVVRGEADGFVWTGRIPAGARLHVGVTLAAEARAAAESLEIIAEAIAPSAGDRGAEVSSALDAATDRAEWVEILGVGRLRAGAEHAWIDFDASLSRWEGKRAHLRVRARLEVRAGATMPPRPLAWGPVILSGARPRPASWAHQPPPHPPNILFVLIDTLRADHVGAYGYGRRTTPEIDRLLGAAGVRFARAYSQAPWTLPSVASLFLGVYPGEFLGGSMASFALPAQAPTLAERLGNRGYETAAFVANPTVHEGIGFGRGFRTFYNPPLTVESMRLSADDLTPRAERWIAAHGRRDAPFFLYVHYIDPHDPYLSPEVIGNRSPFLPDYQGKVAGDWIHGIYNGRLRLEDPERDLEQVRALYDSEIRFVDRHVGRLLSALDADMLSNTLIVLTADHGEELRDHGGWKHGQTLYEEQIRVPLLLRWDGRLAAGRVVEEPVALVDLVPTLLSASGTGAVSDGAAPAAGAVLDGIDLWPVLVSGQTVPRRPIWARHLAGGALRAAVVQDGRKLMLFNTGEATAPADALQSHLERLDRQRLPTVGVFDLARDPGERDNLATGVEIATVRGLERSVFARLDQEIPGQRIVAAGLEEGANLDVTIELQAAPATRAFPLWLRADDRLEHDAGGRTLRLRLRGERFVPGRGILLPPGAVIARLEVSPASIAVYGGQGSGSSRGDDRPSVVPDLTRPGLYVWTPVAPSGAAERPDDEETRARLRALGYIQ